MVSLNKLALVFININVTFESPTWMSGLSKYTLFFFKFQRIRLQVWYHETNYTKDSWQVHYSLSTFRPAWQTHSLWEIQTDSFLPFPGQAPVTVTNASELHVISINPYILELLWGHTYHLWSQGLLTNRSVVPIGEELAAPNPFTEAREKNEGSGCLWCLQRAGWGDHAWWSMLFRADRSLAEIS